MLSHISTHFKHFGEKLRLFLAQHTIALYWFEHDRTYFETDGLHYRRLLLLYLTHSFVPYEQTVWDRFYFE